MTTNTTTKPFKTGQEVYLAYHVPGCPYTIGESLIIASVTNQGTKKNPNYRYYVRGAWLYHDVLSTDPIDLE